jgi:hypothetical protein
MGERTGFRVFWRLWSYVLYCSRNIIHNHWRWSVEFESDNQSGSAQRYSWAVQVDFHNSFSIWKLGVVYSLQDLILWYLKVLAFVFYGHIYNNIERFPGKSLREMSFSVRRNYLNIDWSINDMALLVYIFDTRDDGTGWWAWISRDGKLVSITSCVASQPSIARPSSNYYSFTAPHVPANILIRYVMVVHGNS